MTTIPMSQLIPLLVVVLFLLLSVLVFVEVKRYRTRRAMIQLSQITSGRGGSVLRHKSRHVLVKVLLTKISDLSLNGLERVMFFSRYAKSLRFKLKQAGVMNKNAASYVIAGKLLGALVFIGIFALIFERYEIYQLYPHMTLAVGGLFGWFFPNILIANMVQKRREAVAKSWGDTLDVIVIAVSSGQSIELAMRRAAVEMLSLAPELAKELTITVTELAFLEHRADAYRRLGDRLPYPAIKNFVFDVIQSESLGTPLGNALQSIAKENRLEKTQAAEKKAAALGPKLTVPMILFFFPVLLVVILAPALLKS
ncbi:MAG: type II secretion system F family protein [Gammaproteobacteria bacterium]|nr:type II secretion system F family protein [Gammaproteobacteria bacterium]